MKNYTSSQMVAAVYLLGIVVAILVGVMVSNYNQREIQSQLNGRLDVQEQYLFELAEIIDRNGSDTEIANIISDCPQRNEYEGLLNSLNTLDKRELITAQVLFENCGDFFTDQKELMVSKLERELEIYTDLLDLRESLGHDVSSSKKLEQWNTLLLLEKARSTLLRDQQNIQAQIITLLISGSTAYSKDVQTLVNEAQQMGELLSVDDHQIDEIRKNLK